MQRVIEILNLVKIDLRTQIFDLSIRSKTLKDIVDKCENSFDVRLLKENLKDNTEIIYDSKIDLAEVNKAIKILSSANIDAKTEKRPKLRGN